MANSNKGSNTRMITEGGISIAAAIALSFFKIPIGISFGGFGGSIDLVMVPLVFYALKWGTRSGVLAGLIFGTIKYFLGGSAIDLVSIVFDYSVAYAAVGFAGLMSKAGEKARPFGAFIGCLGRFIIHFISGFTVYAIWMPEEFLNMHMSSPFIYSALYNGTYMLPNTILCVLVIALLNKPLSGLYKAK